MPNPIMIMLYWYIRIYWSSSTSTLKKEMEQNSDISELKQLYRGWSPNKLLGHYIEMFSVIWISRSLDKFLLIMYLSF
jgi:hypothetical protein